MDKVKTYWCIESSINSRAHWLTELDEWETDINKCMKFKTEADALAHKDSTELHWRATVVTEHLDMEVCCLDCQLPYSCFVCDFTVQNNLWNLISPTKDEGGLLCPMCMIKRLKELGLPSINVMVDLTNLKL